MWGWQPTADSYTSATGYEYNSAGGAVQVLRSGVGTYQVRFVNMAGQGGVAHVSGYGANNICTVTSWGPLVGDLKARRDRALAMGGTERKADDGAHQHRAAGGEPPRQRHPIGIDAHGREAMLAGFGT